MNDPRRPTPMSPAEFQNETNVSRETMVHLEAYSDLLMKWQKRINLVGTDTLKDMWRRHFYDSAQLFDRVKNIDGPVADIGSGAGFPGLVLAIMGINNISLIESNNKKCSFLREVARNTDTKIDVLSQRIEAISPHPLFDIVIARALAPMDKLLEWSYPLMSDSGQCLFLKGENYEQELTQCQKKWSISTEIHKSLTNPGGVILEIGKIKPVNGQS